MKQLDMIIRYTGMTDLTEHLPIDARIVSRTARTLPKLRPAAFRYLSWRFSRLGWGRGAYIHRAALADRIRHKLTRVGVYRYVSQVEIWNEGSYRLSVPIITHLVPIWHIGRALNMLESLPSNSRSQLIVSKTVPELSGQHVGDGAA